MASQNSMRNDWLELTCFNIYSTPAQSVERLPLCSMGTGWGCWGDSCWWWWQPCSCLLFQLCRWWCCLLAFTDFLPEIDGYFTVREESREVEQSWHILLWKAQGNLKELICIMKKENVSKCKYEKISVYKMNINIPFIWQKYNRQTNTELKELLKCKCV